MDYCDQGHPPVQEGSRCGPCDDEQLAMRIPCTCGHYSEDHSEGYENSFIQSCQMSDKVDGRWSRCRCKEFKMVGTVWAV